MLKVFLAEDEIIMRDGIKRNIRWEEEGFEFAGEASDGELAYPMILKTKPDILITDIKMPFMDGLELSRLVKQQLPDIKIIILSGYGDFEFARESISIGVTDYLLKPISAAQLLETIKKVEKIILEEQEQKRYLMEFERERQEDRRIARQKFFGKLVSGQMSVSTALNEGKAVGMELLADQYNIMLFQVFQDNALEGYSEDVNQVTEAIENFTENAEELIPIELGLDGWAFIIKETGEKSLAALEEELSERLTGIVKGSSGKVHYFGALGQSVNRLGEMSRCYEYANQVYALRYLNDPDQILSYQKVEEKKSQHESLTLSDLNVNSLNRKIVEKFLKTGLEREVDLFITEYFQSIGENNIESLLFRQYVVMDIYFAAASVVEELGYPSDTLVNTCGDIHGMAKEITSVAGSKAYIKKIISAVISLRENQTGQKYSSLLRDAELFIEQNYFNENISLNMVAASVNLSPSHFSTIFSQKTGRTFIEYLTYVRMEKAKELLRSTSLRSSEIAFEVGYKDPHYFSYLFKKTQECTPREFRARE
ncbi:MAG: response regulator [Clostridiales bacterium]|nr:response regulator [Candidatus Blautia equi]